MAYKLSLDSLIIQFIRYIFNLAPKPIARLSFGLTLIEDEILHFYYSLIVSVALFLKVRVCLLCSKDSGINICTGGF